MATNPKKLSDFVGQTDRHPRAALRTREGRFVAKAVDVDVSEQGHFTGRTGYRKAAALPKCHSLWASPDRRVFFVSDDVVHTFTGNPENARPLALTVRGRTSFELLPSGHVAASDGMHMHLIGADGSVQPSVIASPQPQPTAIVEPGEFVYTFYFAYTDAAGLVGLCSPQRTVQGGALSFDVPVPPTGLLTQIYVTHQNGETPLLAAVSAGGLEVIGEHRIGGAAPTRLMQQIMPGQQLCLHAARLYCARGNTVFYSEPHHYGVMSPFNYVPFPAPVTVLARTPAGLFVVADKTYWLQGTDPMKFELRVIDDDVAAAQSLSYLPDGRPLWLSDSGPVLGLSSGEIVKLTDEVMHPVATHGTTAATLAVDRGGVPKAISTHRREGVAHVGFTMTME